MKNNATVEIQKVNPAQAKVWLGNRHSGQRNVRDSWVEKLASEMKDGRFTLSCGALVLIKSFNAWMKGTRLGCISIQTQEEYPTILPRTKAEDK